METNVVLSKGHAVPSPETEDQGTGSEADWFVTIKAEENKDEDLGAEFSGTNFEGLYNSVPQFCIPEHSW